MLLQCHCTTSTPGKECPDFGVDYPEGIQTLHWRITHPVIYLWMDTLYISLNIRIVAEARAIK
jgi:hypothetical protein